MNKMSYKMQFYFDKKLLPENVLQNLVLMVFKIFITFLELDIYKKETSANSLVKFWTDTVYFRPVAEYSK